MLTFMVNDSVAFLAMFPGRCQTVGRAAGSKAPGIQCYFTNNGIISGNYRVKCFLADKVERLLVSGLNH